MSSAKAAAIVLLLALLAFFAPAQLSAQDATVMTGQVTNVDFKTGTITISHEPNARLGLNQSTDKFRALEPIMLNALRPGAKIKFAADRVNGELAITKILTD
jgi:Cu/Ag efflux protein CusF